MITTRRRTLTLLAAATLLPALARAQSFDHRHAAWDALLAKHVKLAPNGKSSRVDYRGFAAERAALQAYLKSLSAVSAAEYAGWSKPQQFAFLANAYNAYTVEKILTRYPNLKSIRDFGGVFGGNPWKDKFFTLLGQPQSLDGIEHDTLRTPGVFDEPRVHVAVNCASIGCPMLGRQALTADKLDAQLEDLMRRFLSDASRNRYEPASGKLELSRIFDWYEVDFKRGGKSFLGYAGFKSVAEVGSRYVEQLAATDAGRAALRAGAAGVGFLEYDWSLNDAARTP
jgi:hypothetical protein